MSFFYFAQKNGTDDFVDMAVYSDITGTIGETPIVRLNKLPVGDRRSM